MLETKFETSRKRLWSNNATQQQQGFDYLSYAVRIGPTISARATLAQELVFLPSAVFSLLAVHFVCLFFQGVSLVCLLFRMFHILFLEGVTLTLIVFL